jgi:hypothetical protein
LAQMAEVPVVPAIVLDGHFYARVRAWLPARQVRYGVIYGKPLMLRSEMGKAGAAASLEGELREAFIVLYKELADAMSQRGILVTHV